MRTLRFLVDKQIIKQDPECDFSNLIPGTSGYLEAEFNFSEEWNGFIRIVTFSSPLGNEYDDYCILKDGKTCILPSKPLEKDSFKIKVTGIKGEDKITTDYVTVKQGGAE